MKKYYLFSLGIIFLWVFIGTATWAGEKAPAEVVHIANEKMGSLGSREGIVSTVKKQNAKRQDLAAIKELDKKWHDTAGVADFMKPILNSDCTDSFAEIHKTFGYVDEIMAFDRQGALVAASIKPEHYWYGDTPVFKTALTGTVYVGDQEFHTHEQAYVVQVGVPIKDEGTIIGVLAMCIDLDAFEGKGHDHEHYYDDDHDHEAEGGHGH